MRGVKKITILMLLVALVIVVAACGNKKQEEKPEETDVANEQLRETPSYMNAENMPIVNEPITLKIFAGRSPTSSSNWDNVTMWQEYEKMTNIKVDFELVPFNDLSEKRNLSLASGNYPHAFHTSRLLSKDLVNYGSQGMFIRLNELIDEYAPNFKKLLDEHPDLRSGLTMPDGSIYSFPSYYDPEFLPMLIGAPLWIKESWLKELGMDPPETTDDLYNYLKAVKDSDLNENGVADEVPLGVIGVGMLTDQLRGAWGLGNRGLAHPYVDMNEETGELRFLPTDPMYKDMLQYIHKLYDEGLIEKDIFTISQNVMYANGSTGIYGAMITSSPETLMNQTGYVGAPALEGPHGHRLYSHVKSPLVHVGAFVITDNNPHPEATVRWIDHFFGEEGSTMFFMGVEGVSYEKTADGELKYVESILNNADGLTMEQALSDHIVWLGGSYPGYVKPEYFKGAENLPKSVEAANLVAPYAVNEIWPKFNHTTEESDSLIAIEMDISTYTNEMRSRFINGTASFDEWDNYVATLNRMGLEDYMALYTVGYERYIGN